jgi:hypothetical protein
MEQTGPNEDRRVILRSAPGVRFNAATGGRTRGAISTGARRFRVTGASFVEIVAGSAVVRGSLGSTSGRVGMARGTNQIVIADGANGYVFNTDTDTFAQITSGGWRGSNDVQYLDGYFVFVDPDTEQFYLSQIDDASAFDALDFSSADKQPDNIIAQRVFKGDLYLFGATSCEVWVNNGGPDFPFSRYNATPINVGAAGPFSAIATTDELIWLGQTESGSGYVYRMAGYQPRRISTQAVEEALKRSTDLASAWLWTYHVEGHEFVAIEAPGVETTWVFDFATEQWHERARLIDGAYSPLALDTVTFHGGTHYATSGASEVTLGGDSLEWTSGVHSHLSRERTWPHLMSPPMEPVSYRGLELVCSSGAGGNVTLEISNDGGFNFGAPLLRALGVTGRWMQRVRWLMLGASRDRVFRIRCTDAVPFSIHDAAVDA